MHKVNKDSNFSSLIGSKLLFFHIFALDLCFNATLAQLVEQRIRNAWVAGSSPAGGSKSRSYLVFCLLCVAVGRGTTGITNGFFAFFGQKRLAR